MIDQPPCPDCPQCGCNDVTFVSRVEMGEELGNYRCNFCRHEYQDQQPLENAGSVLEVIFNVTRCPHCQSGDTLIMRGPRGPRNIRYHECRDCANTFRSTERH